MSNNENDEQGEETPESRQEVHSGAVGRDTFVSLRGAQSLERLRERIEAAAQELERLRRDNRVLAQRIAELEARPDVAPDQSFLIFDEDQETMQRKVRSFIQAIDSHLAKEREAAAEN